ncbi:MAG TPA: Rv3654c family TadE-like protein [Nocardioides sp.]|nr:Rv3654c family TadE-like protein [Nocardioides sp.]
MREQRGAATVLTVAMAGVLVLVGAAAGVVGAIVAAHRTAQSAADLAALAGAATLADHSGRDPCATARVFASANHADLDSCTVEDADVVVQVTVPGPRWLGQDRDLTARARAGPERS